MKQLIACVLIITSLGVESAKAQKKEFKEQIKKEVAFTNPSTENTLVLKNVFGSITMEGYDGDMIHINVEKTIIARNSEGLELGKRELDLKVIQEGDNRIIVHPDAPYIEYKDGRLEYKWCNDHEEPSYDHNLNFTVRIPKNLNLEVSTINNGEVLVQNTRGNFIKANNINGGIELKNITGQTKVHAINDEVSISYAYNPPGPSTYYSLNGDINITYQKDLSADIVFKSMNGELFTDFTIEKQYAKTSKNLSGKGNKAKYKYESKPVVQIGKGGVTYNFETLNGDVVIKKI